MNRIHQLDYLRGLAAFGIMIYHFLFWNFGTYQSESFIGRVGVYGVSIFYVLSGLTLYYVYSDKLKLSFESLTDFAKKRFFRIFPLLWFATIASIILLKQEFDFLKLFLNLSGLFGIFDWDSYYAHGAWSIGNELVFYLLFPIFVWTIIRNKYAWMIHFFIFFGLYLYFAFVVLDQNTHISEQWRNYVNPLNQAFLFLSGFLLGYFLKNIKMSNVFTLSILLIGIMFFVFYPVKGNTIHLVTDFNRILFTLSCILICIGFYKSSLSIPKIIHKPLSLLGEASYSVYLLHPLVYSLVLGLNKRFFNLPKTQLIIFSVVFTLLVSYLTYYYLEKYFMRLGKRTFFSK